MSLPNIDWPRPSKKYVMPKVAINSVVPSWLTKLRSTSRSISQATANITKAAKANAIRLTNHKLPTPEAFSHSENRAIAKAANKTMAPCAKLNTPEALKINTKPKATSEYSMPAIRPPSSVSRKNPMAVNVLYRGRR